MMCPNCKTEFVAVRKDGKKCGSASGYSAGCRCDKCRVAARESRRFYREYKNKKSCEAITITKT